MTPERWSEIERICQGALDRGPAERAAYVADMCRGDDALRLEIETLLAEECRTAGFMGAPAAANEPVGDGRRLIGRRLGGYVITEWLGAGGMGEVYRGHDAQLGRDVAIKILPAAFVGDPARLERFNREARMLAALNHPNIGAIYGLEHLDGVPAIVLELVEGVTLAEHLDGGPLPVAEALSVAAQIVEALDAAHTRGIVHRDLKPSNIKLTAAGGVKVLDFGLAEELGQESGHPQAGGVHHAAHGSAARSGTVAGTPGYMSPEQANGDALDVRSDIFSFGVVFYEMVTARTSAASSAAQHAANRTLARSLSAPRCLSPAVPPALDAIIRRSMEKERGARYQSAAELRAALKHLEHGGVAPRSPTLRIAAALVAVAAAILIAMFGWLRFKSNAAAALAEYTPITHFADSATSPSLSSDGRMVTFIRGRSTFEGPGQVYVKALPDGQPIQLTDDGLNKMSPTFSPDGRRIAYTTVSGRFEWNTWIVSLGERQPQLWLANASGLSWTAEHQILYSAITNGLHMSLVASDELRMAVRPIYAPAHEAGMVHRSALSPDGRWVLVVEMENPVWQQCGVMPVDGLRAGWRIGRAGQCTSAAWSPDGRWMYFSSNASGTFHIWRQRFPDGAPEQLTDGPTEEEGLALAPDGRSLLTSIGSRQSSLWVRNGGAAREISDEGYAFVPVVPNGSSQPFSADGRRLVYLVRRAPVHSSSSDDRAGELWVTDLSSGRSQSLFSGYRIIGYDVARDNRRIAFAALDDRGTPHIWVGTLDGGTPPRQLSSIAADTPRFAGSDIFCRGSDGSAKFIYRIRESGKSEKVIDDSVLFLMSVSPDGAWLIGRVATAHDPSGRQATRAFPTAGGASVTICDLCDVDWTADGASFVLRFPGDAASARTFVIAHAHGMLPDLPAGGIHAEADLNGLPVLQKIDGYVYPADRDAREVAYTLMTIDRNIYRVSLHR
jgi:eukaryotic-like serine/threonine-protein kinase